MTQVCPRQAVAQVSPDAGTPVLSRGGDPGRAPLASTCYPGPGAPGLLQHLLLLQKAMGASPTVSPGVSENAALGGPGRPGLRCAGTLSASTKAAVRCPQACERGEIHMPDLKPHLFLPT